MTKTELMETYTAEQLADKYLRLQERFNQYTEVIQDITNKLPEELKNGTEFHLEIDCLQSEVEKYRKAFEDAKKERDYQIAEYQKRIEELTDEKESIEMRLKLLKKDRDDLREEVEKLKKTQVFSNLTPIEIANMLINAEGEYEHNPLAKALYKEDKGIYRIFEVSELRQIAEHLLVYCNHNGEVEE